MVKDISSVMLEELYELVFGGYLQYNARVTVWDSVWKLCGDLEFRSCSHYALCSTEPPLADSSICIVIWGLIIV